MEDWYQITIYHFLEHEGRNFISHYQSAPWKPIITLFPEYNWEMWKFQHCKVSKSYWNDINNQKRWFEQVGKHLGVSKMEDWYQISGQELLPFGGSRFLEAYGHSISNIITVVYPEFGWKPWKFKTAKKLALIPFWQDTKNQREFFEGKQIEI